MSDEVRQAAFIGAAINSGLGGIPTAKKKKSNKDTDKTTEETTKTTETTPPPSGTKSLPKTKNPSSKKTKAASAPIFVKSERVNNNTITPTNEVTTGQKQLNVGKQFQQYSGRYGTDRQLPVSLKDLS